MAEEARLEGNKYYKQKDIDNAIASYSKSIDLDSDSPTAALCYSNRSACYQVKKMWGEMQKDAEALAKVKANPCDRLRTPSYSIEKTRKKMWMQ